ncbi:insulinase family protein [bacterium]|nr:insulinase family protein [bacterium]
MKPRDTQRLKAVCALVLGMALVLGVPAHAADAPSLKPRMAEKTLSNGMRVVVVVNRSVPAVMHMIWFTAGSADELPGKGGMAHFLEHWMFKGTKRFPEGAYSREIDKVGGSSNAFTSRDYTAFFARVPKDFLPKLMEMEADRFQHFPSDPKTFEGERNVIVEERKMRSEASVDGMADEEMNLHEFRHHPYRLPTIGFTSEILGMKLEDLKAFYDRYYQPANMILIVGGDVEPEQVFAEAEKHYGPLKAGQRNARQWPVEPPQHGAVELMLTHPLARQPVWERRYLAPQGSTGADAWKADALRLVAYVLGAEPHGVLYQQLVKKQPVATGVNVGYTPLTVGPTSVDISFQPAPGTSRAAMDAAYERVLADFLKNGVTDAQLQQAKDAMIAADIYGYEGISGMPFRIGFAVAVGLPPSYILDAAKRLQGISKEQVNQVAREVMARHAVGLWLTQPPASAKAVPGGKQ